ncbi:MAG: DNA gyrase subunit A [bacterium]
MTDNKEPIVVDKIESIKIEEEMQGAYLEYAMSVIAGRALPDVRDGLKPVHRRILFSMYGLGNTYDKRYLKSARTVGDVIGKYHPHGDSAVYNALVRMAQDFSMRYMLIDGQGNFGSVDGDSAAAMRYTEARMTRFAGHLLSDLEKETVEFGPNYDGTMEEPKVLPSKIPNLLVNGSNGIAVGMSTNIPPHNVGEVLRGTIAIIDNPQIEFDELMKIIPGPDLPTAGIISNISGIRAAYKYGKGSFTMTGRAIIESIGKDKEAIVVIELPYQVNKSTWIENIASLVRDKEIEGITDLRDESNREGMRVVIELRKGEASQIVLNNLYAKTQLRTNFGVIMLAIENGRPRLFSLKDSIVAFIDHRRDVVTKRCVFELRKARDREHLLEGLRIALDQIDAVVDFLKKTKDAKTAKEGLQDNFKLSERQAQAVLDMRLQRLTAIETQKLISELEEIKTEINYLNLVLGSDIELMKVIKAELTEMLDHYGDKRRSEISLADDKGFNAEDFLQDEQVVVTITNSGYAKRSSVEDYRSQGRGGKGIKGADTGKDDDFVKDIFVASTLSYLLCFTNLGRLHWLKVHQVPEMSRTARGRPLVQLLQLVSGEEVLSILPIKEFVENKYIVMATKQGVIKKTDLMAFSNIRAAGIIAIAFDDGDSLVKAALSDGKQDIFVATKLGQSIRFSEEDVRDMGRNARGVRGIKLDDKDAVVGMEIFPTEENDKDKLSILSVSTLGYGKRTPLNEYRTQGRGGSGIINIKVTDKIGELVAVKLVRDGDDAIVISNVGQLIRTPVSEIREIGRNTQGVRVINMDDGESVKAFAITREVDESQVEETSSGEKLN